MWLDLQPARVWATLLCAMGPVLELARVAPLRALRRDFGGAEPDGAAARWRGRALGLAVVSGSLLLASIWQAGNLRVGLEDSIWAGKGELATSNTVQVKKVRQIIEGLGLAVASPDDAREILALKGGDQVAF